MQRKQFIRTALAFALAAAASVAFADNWPSRPITMVIPFPPGGTLDYVGRLLAQKLGEQLGQSIIVDNRPGGGGTIGPSLVSRAAADGYTLLFNASAFTTTPMTMKSPPYDVLKDFQPVALVAKAPLAVVVNSKLPITDVKSLVSYAKANPGHMSFAIGSSASAGHLATELLKRAAGIDYLIVPYKGSSPAYQDLVGGQIDGFIDPILGSAPFVKTGMLRVVAVTSKARLPSMPDVPALSEAVPGYEFYSWYGVWGPAKLPKEIAQRLNTEINKALAGDMKTKLLQQGLLLAPGSIDEFAAFEKDDMARAQKIVTEGNIHAE